LRKITITLAYVFALAVARLVDSFYTYAVFRQRAGRMLELNPFASTEGIFGVLLSPVLVMATVLFVWLFSWMVYHPERVLDECTKKDSPSNNFWKAEDYVWLPFLAIAMVVFGVLQNASLFHLGEPFVPPLIRALMPENPTLRLFCYSLIIALVGRPHFRTAMLSILRYVCGR
jgi:hypothetical protein